ncbi:MAG: hypothetical protein AAB336_10220 [Acidobacteriota bacterium]
MNEYLLNLIQQYKSKGILIDTNLALLYLVGLLDISLIRNFSRTSMFTEEDFERIKKFVDYFDFKVTTPNILTEVSDLIDNRQDLQIVLRGYIQIVEELFVESKEVCQEPKFIQFGLADMATLVAAKDSYLVFTDDRPLYGYLVNSGIDAVNLDQIRMI